MMCCLKTQAISLCVGCFLTIESLLSASLEKVKGQASEVAAVCKNVGVAAFSHPGDIRSLQL